ncbi:hypothetical protein FLONG3_5866 [Fusarium longipes]|uniref:Uncharacterized protein n=1 Tax=Fusarium longipes TaxID=694270 RepID=A0A395SRE1_9HYPO|nr:hypothetical protein FLONG3_5866 [Fusarium longipes]
MPQRSFSNQLQSVWDRLTRRRDTRKPRRYADVAAAQRRSQALDSRFHQDESLVSLEEMLRQTRLSAHSRTNRGQLSTDTGNLSDQSLIDRSLNRSTIYGDPPAERVKIPVVHCATPNPDAPGDDEETDDPIWYLPGNIHLSPSGLIGHEDGINLPLMLTALSFAFDHNLVFEIDNLKSTIGRYIVARMFYHNPHSKSFSLGEEYFKFRSEEIYQAWVAVTNDKRFEKDLTPDDLITLYICIVQYKWWRDLIRGYDYNFNTELLMQCKKFQGNPHNKFEEIFRLFHARTCFGRHPWMEETLEYPSHPEVSEDFSNEAAADPPRTGLPYSIFQPPVETSDNSDDTERRLRHIRRETSVIPPDDESIDLIEFSG